MGDLKTIFTDEKVKSLKAEIYLIRGYQFSANPYAIIDDLPDEEAKRICQETFPGRPDDYLTVRRQVNSWLRNEAEKSGVRIDKENPVSFALVFGKKELDKTLAMLSPEDNMVVLNFKDVDLTNWSFTSDDAFIGAPQNLKGSFRDKVYPDDPLHGHVLNTQQLIYHLLKGHRLDGLADGTHRYYEAQLWGNKPTLLNSSANPNIYLGITPP